MPPQIRELIAEVGHSGFINRGGKGNHRNFEHPLISKVVTISGKSGDDVQRYQLKQANEAIREAKGK